MPFHYATGQQILPGDHVLLNGDPATIEFVADPAARSVDPGTLWYLEQFGGGVTFVEPSTFGHLFIDAAGLAEEHLQLLSRSQKTPS